MADLSKLMELELAKQGIFLDAQKPRSAPPAKPAPAVVDRAYVRAELERRGATPAQLVWLVPSCPSHEAARAFCPIKQL